MPTFSATITATADDGSYATPPVFSNSAITILLSPSIGFFRFPGVTIPNAATINAATIRVRAAATLAFPGTITVSGELAANSAQMLNAADAVSRARTTHSVLWSPGNLTLGTDYTSSDITTVIQEIVNQGGFASGNAIQLFLAAAGGNPVLVAQDGSTPAGLATVSITYSAVVIPKTSRPFWLFEA